MKTQSFLITLLVTLLAFSVGARAESLPGAGGGGDSGEEVSDYGDLFILHRDEFAVPMLTGGRIQGDA